MEDLSLRKFFSTKEERHRPNWQEIISEDNSAKIYWSQWESLVIENGILCRKWEASNFKSHVFQILVPRGRVKQILEEAHDSFSGGHFGVNKTLDRIRNTDFTGQLASRMLKIGVELAWFVKRKRVLLRKADMNYKFIMLEHLLKGYRWTFLVHSQFLFREIDIC